MPNDFQATPGAFQAKLRDAMAHPPPREITLDGTRDAAVLIPIVAVPEPTLIFTLRTEHLPSHKGQISFPGGSIDLEDPSPEFAALREAQEEIGLDPNLVTVMGRFDDFPTYVTGYVVSPVVGWIDEEPTLTPNPVEVAEVLHVPLRELANDIRREAGFTLNDMTYPTEAWVWNDHIIWGVTARVVRVFLERLAAAGLVEQPTGTGAWPELARHERQRLQQQGEEKWREL